MKLLVNATVCVVGGGVQVATSFILNALSCREHQWLFAVSAAVKGNLAAAGLAGEGRLVEVSPPPSAPLRGRAARTALRRLERDFAPDVVFTVFGPAYVNFKSPHLCGFAVPWTTHPNREAYGVLTPRQKAKRWLLRWKDKLALRMGDYYLFETEVAKDGLARFVGFPPENAAVVANTYAPVFAAAAVEPRPGGPILKLLTLSSYYRHKNLEIIPAVAAELRKAAPGRGFRFTLTLPPAQAAAILAEAGRLGVGDMVANRGPVKMPDCPALYNEHDFVFMPTLLETFTATYPEAMRMERPIVTTDLDFARDICRGAASYYSPLSAVAAAARILELVESPDLAANLVEAGRERLGAFPTPEGKFKEQLGWLVHAAEKSKATGEQG